MDCIYWSGTAPFCAGRCPDYCTVIQSSSSGTGATCSTGVKLLCDCCPTTPTLTTTATTATTIPPTTVTPDPTTVIQTTIVSSTVTLSGSVNTPLSALPTTAPSHGIVNGAAIAGAVVGGLALFALIIVVGLHYSRNRRRHDELEAMAENQHIRPPPYPYDSTKEY